MKKFLLSLCTILAPVFLFAQQAEEKGVAEKINEGFKPIADAWGSFVFYPVNLGGGVQMPIVIIMLLSAGLLFTILFKFVNIILFPTSINIVRGKYDDVDHATSDIMAGDPTPSGDAVETIRVEGEGEVSHFQALTAALSGTVGLGNIAGVAVALSLGGPGATFWMILAGLLGMSSKFVECTLGVKYRDVGEDGTIYGGPMYYLKKGLADVGKSSLGKILAVIFAVMVIGGSFGGGNMFQANQAAQQFGSMIGSTGLSTALIFGVVMSLLVGIVI